MSTPFFNPGPPFYTTATITTTTKKQNTFISTPLQDCALHDVPGVGDVAHARLVGAGVETAEQLVGHFLVSKRDPQAMTQWLLAAGVRVQEVNRIVAALEKKVRVTVAV